MSFAGFLAFAVVWVVGGNALISLWSSRLQRRMRAELESARTLFEERSVRASTYQWALVGAGVRWVTADVLVTDRVAVLFPRSFVMTQPPIVLLRSESESTDKSYSGVTTVVITAPPQIEPDRVVIEGKTRAFLTVRWRIVLRSSRPTELAGALDAFLHPVAGDGAFRTSQARS